jgi:hypothetical protein
VLSSKKKKPFCFEVATPSRTYYLQAESEKEMMSWIETVKLSIEGKVGFSEGTNNGGKKKIGVLDFDLLHVIGKGSFGKVGTIGNSDPLKLSHE